ncbi:magnesium chelatase subunit D [Pontivivens insulae]|uniref:Magnesium-chelatase 60 kDa subunit n=1 Tax=Pontivivens insulae TaxID=1639689 RepID=A0A2R8A9R7_9RHOB|nr:magnesium chelatase subunit D [Pontivivens insulae]RED12899.1 protoporphyrin IX magnesium-chelatase [Pontivivens insulae]SPF28991.1 Magnesium-chelatase 60 kDa subunit [Pontivivens insulae]
MIADALSLFAQSPQTFGGLVLRARVGPARDRVLQTIRQIFPHARKITPATDDAALFGALDVVATLAEGREVRQPGLVSPSAILILSMAERVDSALSARLATALDKGELGAIIALDEGEDDETLHPALSDRLAFHIDLDGSRADTIKLRNSTVPTASISAEQLGDLTLLAARLGIAGLRAPLQAVNAARGLARLVGQSETTEAEIIRAAELVLLPRARQIPAMEEEQEQAPPPPDPDSDAEVERPRTADAIPDDILLDAIKAQLPPELLTRLTARAHRGAKGAGAGARKKGNRRGRPLPARPGRPGQGDRLDLVATLRMAAPWQTIRREAQPHGPKVLIRPTDLRLRRFEERSDRLLIFGVDASASTAMARLAEAKGAVEQLLAEAYARRDHVALIAFRGENAELVLSPTRALVAAKRSLQGLAGGGGTPLASGLMLSATLAGQSASRGMSPTLILLTDGKGNISLSGEPGRATAREDSENAAKEIARAGWPALVIDTAHRPQASARDLSIALRATYLPMPRADAARLTEAVTAALRPT